jgi:hypothetical protein
MAAGEPAAVSREPVSIRDDLLRIAREAVRSAERQGVDPVLAGEVIVDAWLDGHPHLEVVDPTEQRTPGTIAADPAFTPEPLRGVESLAFVVYGNGGGAAAGIILRIPGEYPDSYEVVGMPDSRGHTPDEIRAVFYG